MFKWCLLLFSFLLEQDEEWIQDKTTVVDYLKKIWLSEAYHTLIVKVQNVPFRIANIMSNLFRMQFHWVIGRNVLCWWSVYCVIASTFSIRSNVLYFVPLLGTTKRTLRLFSISWKHSRFVTLHHFLSSNLTWRLKLLRDIALNWKELYFLNL